MRFTYDSSGLLEVLVTSCLTKQMYQSVFKQDNIDLLPGELDQILNKLSYLKIHPRDQEENKLFLETLNRLHEEHLGETRKLISKAIGDFENVLQSQHLDQIAKKKTEMQSFFNI